VTFVHTIRTAGWPEIRRGIGRLRKRPEQERRTHPAFFSPKGRPLIKGTMNNIRKPLEPNREVVERAIAEVLGIAQRRGITPADFVRMLDSGVRMSDFLTAVDLG